MNRGVHSGSLEFPSKNPRSLNPADSISANPTLSPFQGRPHAARRGHRQTAPATPSCAARDTGPAAPGPGLATALSLQGQALPACPARPQDLHLSPSTLGRILAQGVRLGRIRPCAFCRGRVKLRKRRCRTHPCDLLSSAAPPGRGKNPPLRPSREGNHAQGWPTASGLPNPPLKNGSRPTMPYYKPLKLWSRG